HQRDFDGSGFEWISADDSAHSVLAYLRHGNAPKDTLLVVFNGTPVPHHNYRLGAPQGGRWQEIFNSDASIYGGTDVGNQGFVDALDEGTHGRPYSLELILPPLGLLVFKHVDTPAAKALPKAKGAAPAAKKPEAAPATAKPAKAEAPAPKAAVAKTSAAPKAFETRAAEPKAAAPKAAAPKAAAPKAAAPKAATTSRTRTSTAKTAAAGTTAKATKAAAPKAASSRTTATTKAKPASSRSKG
ncbi:MAG: alpha amylase C-terminal domain-containing protein, partial [Lautropia mirabilis]|nr:alpha amylase C-terminal domain-containing protein [Lautropia mirabilis]